MGNIASGNDRVAVQVGHVTKGGSTKKSSTTTKGGGTGETVNVRSGNARVGEQVDEIHGGIQI